MKNLIKLAVFILTLFNPAVGNNENIQQAFSLFIDKIKQTALQKGISQKTIDKTLTGLTINEKVLILDSKQPEFSVGFGYYLNKRVSAYRLNKAKAFYQKHQKDLKTIEKQFGVPGHIIVSFLALESNLGSHTGNFTAVQALATLAFNPRRSDFFTNELLHLLALIDQGKLPYDVNSSWAGALGTMQFMPSNVSNFAIDYNQNNLDIWQDYHDIFSSAANFLKHNGWIRNLRWGREVILPDDFDYQLSGLGIKKNIQFWKKIGVLDANYEQLPNSQIKGSILLPAGHTNTAFLVYQNFHTILNWNRSIFYALSVGHLADQIIGRKTLTIPSKITPHLSKKDIKIIQKYLNKLQFDAGKPDGIIGRKTRKAAQAFQKKYNLIASGHVDLELLEQLKSIIEK